MPKRPNQLEYFATYLQERVEGMLVLSIDIQLLEEMKAGFEPITWSNIFQAVEDFGGIGSGLLLKSKKKLQLCKKKKTKF